MFGQSVQFQGDSLESSKIGFQNLTGQQLVPGQVYAMDLPRANALTTTARQGLSNAVNPVAANLQGILFVAEQASSPNDFGQGVVMGYTNAFVSGGPQSAVSEVQTLTVTGTPSAGTWRIQFTNSAGNQVETNQLAFGASLATIQTALDAVSGGANQIVAGGTALTAMTLTFSGNLYTGIKQPIFSIDANDLTSATSVTVVRTTEGIAATNNGGVPMTRLKAVAGQNYLMACDPGVGNTDCCIAVQLDKTFGQITAPGGAPTLAALNSGGTLAGGITVYVKYEWQGAGGVTTASPEQNVAIPASAQPINSVSVTTAVAPVGATSAKVFVSTAPGQEVFVGSVNVVTGVAGVFTITALPPASNGTVDLVNTSGIQMCPVFFCGFAFMGSFYNPALT